MALGQVDLRVRQFFLVSISPVLFLPKSNTTGWTRAKLWTLTQKRCSFGNLGASRSKPIFIFSSVFRELIIFCCVNYSVIHVQLGRVAQSVQRLTTGWAVRGSKPGGTRFSARSDRPCVHPASCTTGTWSLPGLKYGRGVLLTTHPLLVPCSWKSRAIPLPTLWATTGPVTGTLQSCTWQTQKQRH